MLEDTLFFHPLRFLRGHPWPRIQRRFQMRTVMAEFTPDLTQPLFVCRAIARMAIIPYVPIFLVEQLLGLAANLEAMLLGRALAGSLLCLLGIPIMRVVQKQAVRVRNWRMAEHTRIAEAIELTVFEKPLSHGALRHRAVFGLSGYHPLELARAVFNILGHLSHMTRAATTVWLAARATDQKTAVAALVLSLVGCLLARAMRFLVDWTNRTELQPYDPISEICANITTIKMFAWEKKYLDWAKAYTEEDSTQPVYIRVFRHTMHIVLAVFQATLGHLTALIVLHAPATQGDLVRLRRQIHILVEQIADLFDTAVKWQDLRESNQVVEHGLRAETRPTIAKGGGSLAVDLRKCDFSWDQVVLSNIELQIPCGEFVMVRGKIGQGKSSLLEALSGEMEMRGEGAVNGRVAHVGQQPFILSGSVRANITFGLEHDHRWYTSVLKACALDEDIGQMAHGDLTTVSQATLSGGQRARVALARAVYHNRDIYLLDDTLAAVDPGVARQLLMNVLLGPTALLKPKTRVLVSNNDALCAFADQIITIDNGRISVVRNRQPQPFHSMPTVNTTSPVAKEGAEKEEPPNAKVDEKKAREAKEAKKAKEAKELKYSLADSFAKLNYYFQTCGWAIAVVITLVSFVESSLWNMAQSRLHHILSNPDPMMPTRYLKTDYLIAALRILVIKVEQLYNDHMVSHHCAPRLNTQFVHSILYAPTFDYQGVTNAFYAETEVLRRSLPYMLKMEMVFVTSLAAAALRVWRVGGKYALVGLPLLVWATRELDHIYLPVHTRVLRLGTRVREELVATRQTIVQGTRVIRGLGQSAAFMDEYINKFDNATKQFHMVLATNALNETARAVCAEAMTLLSVVLCIGRYSTVTHDLLTSCHNMVNSAMHVARFRTRLLDYTEYINSYMQFATLPKEQAGTTNVDGWPQEGQITFANYSMRYSGGPRVLDDICLDIRAGEKIGVVGRTGAGKSSLAKALFRLVEADAGAIYIDSKDISTIDPSTLRSQLAIIPQDPVLFAGSMRDNIDPLKEHTIEELWAAIVRAQLTDLVNQKAEPAVALMRSLTASVEDREKRKRAAVGPHCMWRRAGGSRGLDKWIEYDGRGYSIGQRQLVGLCRALLRRRKILVLDEATASMDGQTDQVVHRAIREEFRDSTVITIAHRLDTLAESDRIVVLDKGKVVQVGTKNELMHQAGLFAQLVHEQNI
ncbi:P-loop containing nucleoside triphosphate hydrolase protein [Coemansia spiralis]|nr:P-loop containing nucleoside triphosphate hydrolase protein [Coemansia spiralis]